MEKDGKEISMLQALCFLLFTTTSLLMGAGNSGEIHGIIKSERGERLKGAQVVVEGLKIGAVATAHGHYRIVNVPAGECLVTVSMTGYQSRTEKVTVMESLEIELDFILESRIINLSPVVVTATMTEKEVNKVPAAVEVLDQAEIDEMGAETLADALKESQSLALEGSTGRAMVASLRGLRSNHSLILVDGRRISTGFRNNVDLDVLPINMIQRIEIVRGPTSALYGSDAVGGVINIITKEPSRNLTGGYNLRYGQSTYGEAENPLFKGHLSGKKGRIGFSSSGLFNLKKRYDRDVGTAVTDGDEKRIKSGTGKLSFDLSPGQQLVTGLDYSIVNHDGIRTFGWGNGRRRADSNRRSVFIEYRGELWNHSELIVKEYHSHFDIEIDEEPLQSGNWYNPLTGTKDPFHLDQDLNQVETRWSGLLHKSHLVTAGAEYRSEHRKDNFFDNNVDNSAIFIQDEFQVTDPFLLVFGARYDRHSDFGGEISPKVSGTYAIRPNLRFKFSYGEGFRAPNIFELFVETDSKKNIIRSNPNLNSETSRSFEFGLEGESGVFSGEIRFFRNDIDEMINTIQIGVDTLTGKTLSFRPIFEYRNLEKAMTQGLEVNASINLPLGFSLSDEASIMDTEDKTTGKRLFNRSNFLNTWKLAYSNAPLGIKANLRANTVGGQKTSETIETESYTIWNLYTAKKLSKYFEAYAGVKNIFNSDPEIYGFEAGARLEGTYFFGGISAKFN
jgi:outer membrane receptor for ferrienterochelin and colicins